MATPGGLVDKQELIDAQLDTAHLGRVVNSKDASGDPISESTNRTGGVNKTLDALETEYLEAIQGAGGIPIGTWTVGVTTFTKYNEYAVYNGIPYKPRTSTTLPYVAQGADPTAAPDDANVQPFSDITREETVDVIGEYSRYVFDNTVKMSSSDPYDLAEATFGTVVSTRGFNTPGDGGSAKYKKVADNTVTDGVDGHHEGSDFFQFSGFQMVLVHSSLVFPEQFGVVFDWDDGLATGTDNTAAINNMIDYVSPYSFDTDIPTTKANLGNTRAKIFGGVGKARTTSPILINPFIKWEGIKTGAFFDNAEGGTHIVADWDSDDDYIMDAANIKADGTRPTGQSYSKAAWDGGTVAGVMGWHLSSLIIRPAASRTLKGGVNRQVSQQSVLEYCSVGNGGGILYEAVRNSVCWGGSVNNNLLRGTAYCMRNQNDVTTDVQQNNYLALNKGFPAPSPSVYTYVNWPSAALQDKTACLVSDYSDPHLYSNTYEGAQIGVQATNGPALRDINGFFEAIDEFIYGAHTIPVDVRPKWVFCASASIISFDGSPNMLAQVDLSAASFIDVAGIGSVSAFVKGVNVKGSSYIFDLPYNSRVFFSDLAIEGVVNVYVDNSGLDTNTGYVATSAVLTFQEALSRCIPGMKNIIHLASGQTIATKANLFDGTTVTRVLSNTDITVIGNNSTIDVGSSGSGTFSTPMAESNVKFEGVTIDLTNSASSGNFRSFLRAKGHVNWNLESCEIVGSGKYLFGNQDGEAGTANIKLRNVTLGNGVLFATNSGEANAFAWIETSVNVINNGAAVGVSNGRLFSATFP